MAVSQECKTTFDEVKQKRLHRYIVYHIEDEKMIVVEKIGSRDASYDDFLADLTKGGESECRYGLYDFEYLKQCEGTDAPSEVNGHMTSMTMYDPVSVQYFVDKGVCKAILLQFQ